MLEPIQGEAGVVVPKDGYLREVREICNNNKVRNRDCKWTIMCTCLCTRYHYWSELVQVMGDLHTFAGAVDC